MYISKEAPYWKTRKGVIMEEYTTFAKKPVAILNQKSSQIYFCKLDCLLWEKLFFLLRNEF